MAITIPTQTATGSLIYSEFNQLVEAFKDGTRDYKASGLDLTNARVHSGNTISFTGSPYGIGLSINMLARTNISGGMFVSASGNLAYAAPVSTLYPIGMAKPGVDVASGGTVQVITHGVVPAKAEGTIAIGASCMMGAGAAQNAVIAVTAASGIRKFGVLDAGASGSTVFIVL